MIYYISFSQRGQALAERLSAALGGAAHRCGPAPDLAEWTAAHFAAAEALVFVGAAGIAVRAVAPHVKSKTTDPAVVAVDECGHFAVPLLSGHLGGANDLARRIGQVCGAVPVITTGTDANGVFSPDAWARNQNCAVVNPARVKPLSARLLAGGTVTVRSDFAIAGEPPAGVLLENGAADVRVSVHTEPADGALCLAPRAVVLGVGCRRGTEQAALEAALTEFLRQNELYQEAICAAASIDLKQNEAGLLAFCAAHGWGARFYSAAQLAAVPGSFTASAFVASVTGVDNVCERAAALAAGGPLLAPKYAAHGVTLAAAQMPVTLNWRWQYAG